MACQKSLRRFLLLMATGGCLFQAVGCASGVLPVFFSFVESAVFTAWLTQLPLP